MTSDTHPVTDLAPDEAPTTEPSLAAPSPDAPTVDSAHPVHPYVHVVIMAVFGAISVLIWLRAYEWLNRLIWGNDTVTANPWLFPVICLPFSFAVGWLVKSRDAPNNLKESLLDSLTGDLGKIDWRGLPVNIVMALVSLLSGAVLGPEGGIGGIASKLAALYQERVRLPDEERPRLVFSSIAAAYNGLIANPLFTGVLALEIIPSAETRAKVLPTNLIGGSIGFLVFYAAGSTGLENYLHLPASTYQPIDVVLVVLFGLVGLVMAIITGAMFQVAATFFGRFKDRPIERALVAGVVFSAVGVVAPIVLFSGENQIHTVVADPAKYGAAVLMVMAFVKLALLAVAFKSGFLGGPTFPSIFATVCVSLAIGLVFPGLPQGVVIGGTMAGFLMVLFKAPFMVTLLTVVMLQATAELTALIILAVAAVMIVQPYLVAAIAARRAARQAARSGATPAR